MEYSLQSRLMAAERGVSAHAREAVVDRAARERAFERLAVESGPRALSVARGLLGTQAAAEDAVQEAFERAYRALDQYRGEAELSTWFMRIVVHTAYRHGRRRRRFVFWKSEPRESAAPREATPEERSQAAQIQRRLDAAVCALPKRQRTAFVLRYLEGLSTEESAEIMDCAPGTVKATLHAAVGKLRRELSDLRDEEIP